MDYLWDSGQQEPSSESVRDSAPAPPTCLPPIHLDLHRFSAWADGRRLALTRIEFDILAYLVGASRAVPAEEILKRVIGGAHSVESSLVRVHIANLRRKLGPRRHHLETIRGRGFCFVNEMPPRDDLKAGHR